MERYDSYKDSGVDWLGEIPAHWDVRANRTLFKERNEPGVADLPILSVSLHTGVSDEEQDDEDNARTRNRIADKTAYRRVRRGDVAYNMMRAWQGAIGAVRTDGMVSPAYVVAAPRMAMNPDYFEYQYRTDLVIREMDRASKGITDFRKRLYWNEFKQMSTIVPPPKDQERIVAFLDQKTAEIDAAIAKKERLIELLQEQKSILINQAVTRGLNPDVPLRDSGVEWIGQIPAHWEVMKIKYVLKSIVDTEHKTPVMSEDGPVLVVRTSNVRDGKLRYTDAKYTDELTYIRWNRRATPEPGDILFTREAPAGEACVLPHGVKAVIGQRMVLFKVDQCRLNASFAVHSIYTGAAKVFIEVLSNGSTVAHFNMSDIGNIPVLLPSLDEQNLISERIEKIDAKSEAIISAEQVSLGHLQELKRSLIASAVTGKIKV